MMKPKELKQAGKVRDLTVEELLKEEREIGDHLMKLRFQQAAGQVENPTIIREYRRGLARVKTVLAQKRQGAERQGS
jgi:large subunit ribosomal protein L29